MNGADLGVVAWEEWGQYGVKVFPCSEDKRPLCKWQQVGSTDKAEIIRAFSQAGDRAALIGGVMGESCGLFALDFDLYKAGGKAQEFMDILRASNCLPDTRIHKTKSGGVHHIYYAPESMAVPRNSVPYDEVEIRGEGGYIILPPVGGYSVIASNTTEAPEELIDRLNRAQRAFNGLSINKLKAKIIEGKSFHEAATLIAAKLSGRGKKPETIREVLSECFQSSVGADPSHHRHSRWLGLVEGKDGELGRILSSAYSKFNPVKADDAVKSLADPRGKVNTGSLFGQAPTSRSPEKGIVADDSATGAAASTVDLPPVTDEFPFKRSYEATKVADEDDKNFLVYPLIMESDVIVLSAEPKAGKTLTTMNLCLHMAAGLPFGELTPINKDGEVACIPVVYFALEGQGAIRKRVRAWLQFQRDRGVTLDEGDVQLYVVEQAANLTDDEAKQALVDKLVLADLYFKKKGWTGIGMVVIDTLTKAMPGKDQNSVEDTSSVFNSVDMMRESGLQCAVMFIHHNAKAGKGPRGSSNILAEPDTILSVEKQKPVIVDNVQHDTYELSVFMSRAIDDTQVYKMKSHVVDIGKNGQGIEENAPVLDIMDNYSVPATMDDEVLRKQKDKAKGEFYGLLYKVLSGSVEMTVPLLLMHRTITSSANAPAAAYYSSYVNGNTKEQVRSAWKVLLSADEVPLSLSGVTFSQDEGTVKMHLDLAAQA